MASKKSPISKQTTERSISHDLMDFIARSPTPFHVVANLREELDAAGYVQQNLGATSAPVGQFYFIQNDASLIAVSINAPIEKGFHIVGAHTDSPCLKVKPKATYMKNGYLQLGVEVYGGALLAPWFDRDLSLAGRVTLEDKHGALTSKRVNFKRPIGVIPSLAIHLNRGVNDSNAINKQTHLPPILDVTSEAQDLESLLLDQLKREYPSLKIGKVLAHELSLYDTQAPALIGINQNLVASARLDNLLSSYIAHRALLARSGTSNSIVVLTDHEEVGSTSAAGAAGPFLEAVIRQICGDEAQYRQALGASLLISADNAHAVHPNYDDRHEPRHQPVLNKGPVIKINHNQRYASNSKTQGIFAQLCESVSVPYQPFVVRSDMGCGSTIGPITAAELGIATVDIGAPQLAMHSVRELAGAADCDYLYRALKAFFDSEQSFDFS